MDALQREIKRAGRFGEPFAVVMVVDSAALTPTADTCCIGRRGNVDGFDDGGSDIDIGDLVYLVDYMFTDGPPPTCVEEANIDASCCAVGSTESLSDIDISDLVYLVDYMFTGGPEPTGCP